MTDIRHLTTEELETGLDKVRQAPRDEGLLELIVRRPATEEREVLEEAELDLVKGLVGDNWASRGSADPDRQLTVMSSRAAALVAQQRDRWQLAGDQLYLDIDLSIGNLPPGSRMALGEAVIEITEPPHTGCRKFVDRFGLDAMKFVNSPVGRDLRLRGANAKVVRAGTVRRGDVARKL